MFTLMKRNTKLFFRDRMTVFFSLLSSVILIGLYFVFLEGTLSSEAAEYMNTDLLMFNWLIAGILAINSISTTLTTFGTKIKDDEKDISKDFHSTPASKAEIAGGYIGAAFFVSMLISVFTLLISQVISYFQYGAVLSVLTLLKVLGITLVTVFSNSALMYLIILSIHSSGAYSMASSLIGSFSGFLAGIYIPIGVLPDWAGFLIKLFPASQSASLLRRVLMADEFQRMGDVPNEVVVEVKETLGVLFTLGDGHITGIQSFIYVLVTGIIFYALAVRKLAKND